MKRSIFIFLGSIILFCLVFMTSLSNAKPYDPMGWDEILEKASQDALLHSYINIQIENDLYAQRDYFRHSIYGQLTFDIYRYWDDIKFNRDTIPSYIAFFEHYNPKIYQLMYVVDSKKENLTFLDDELYRIMKDILDYHRDAINTPSFNEFRKSSLMAMDNLKGKSYAEAREMLFGVGPTASCAHSQIVAGLCN